MLGGRDFTAVDMAGQRPVAIVDRQLAHRLWPGGAIGRRLAIEKAAGAGAAQELEIVGVTASVRSTRVRDDDIPHLMVPFHVYPIAMSLVVRTGLRFRRSRRRSAKPLTPRIPAAPLSRFAR